MKFLLAAVFASTLAAPVLAAEIPVTDFGITVQLPTDDILGRRSGLCPSGKGVAREGSTCGGV